MLDEELWSKVVAEMQNHPYATVLARCLHENYVKLAIPPGQGVAYLKDHGVRLTDLVTEVNAYQSQWQASCPPLSFEVGTRGVLERTITLEPPTKGAKQQALDWFTGVLLKQILGLEKYYLSTKGQRKGTYYGLVKKTV